MLLVESLDDTYLLDLKSFEFFGNRSLILGTFDTLNIVDIIIAFNYGSHHVVSDCQTIFTSLLDLLRAQLFRFYGVL